MQFGNGDNAMPTRNASAKWEGGLKGGKGSFTGATGLGGQYNFSSRFENGEGSNPEELLAAAEAACFSMALSARLEEQRDTADERGNESVVHDRESRGRVLDHEDGARRDGDGAEHRRRGVSEDRGGDEGRMSGVEGAEGNSGDHAERQAGVMHEIDVGYRDSSRDIRHPIRSSTP